MLDPLVLLLRERRLLASPGPGQAQLLQPLRNVRLAELAVQGLVNQVLAALLVLEPGESKGLTLLQGLNKLQKPRLMIFCVGFFLLSFGSREKLRLFSLGTLFSFRCLPITFHVPPDRRLLCLLSCSQEQKDAANYEETPEETTRKDGVAKEVKEANGP